MNLSIGSTGGCWIELVGCGGQNTLQPSMRSFARVDSQKMTGGSSGSQKLADDPSIFVVWDGPLVLSLRVIPTDATEKRRFIGKNVSWSLLLGGRSL